MVSSLTDFAALMRREKVKPFVHSEGVLRDVHASITDMMKQLANEPSVGLYFVQQHVHKAVPGMVSLKTRMVENTQEVEYVTQDVKDALNSVRTMKEVGPAVVERMIKTFDSSLPRLASLRPLKRDGHLQDSLSRTGTCQGNLFMQPSEKQDSSPTSPKLTSMEQSSADAASGFSNAVDYQQQLDPEMSKRTFSGQALLEDGMSRQSTSERDYAGYMRTMFDSAFQTASTVANVSKWNSYSKPTRTESSLTGVGGDLVSSITSGPQEKSPRFHFKNVWGATYDQASGLGKTASVPSMGTSVIHHENLSMESNMHEVQEISASSLERMPSLPAFKAMADYGNPGQYVRALFGSAGSVSREGSRGLFVSRGSVSMGGSNLINNDWQKPSSTANEPPPEAWNWLQVPRNAMRSFSKQPEKLAREESMTRKEPSSDMAILDQVTSGSASSEDGQRILKMEKDSYEAFAAEKAAKFEEWLQDTEGDDRKETD